MNENFRDAGIRHVDEISRAQKAMVEKALYMRAQSYLASVKAQLLMATIYEVEGQRKELKRVNLGLKSSLGELQKQRAELTREIAYRKAIFNTSGAGMMVVDADFKIEEVNPHVLEICGYAHEELVGHSSSLLHSDAKEFAQFCSCVSASRECHEFSIRRKDGSHFWCEVSGRPINRDDPKAGVICVLIDISARKRAEAEVQERAERQATLIEALPHAIWFKDHENRWLEVNSIGLSLFNMVGTAWRGKSERDFAQIYPEQRAAHMACLASDEKAWEKGDLCVSQEIVLGEDGEELLFEVSKVPLFHPDGSRKALLVVGRDVTLQKRNEQALIQAKEMADTANRAKSTFLASMSHELRTPLNAMLGYAQILGRDQRLAEDQHQAVETIRRSGDHLLTLINDVLDLAKVEAGRFELQPAPCELKSLLVSQVELFEQRAGEKGLEFRQSFGTLPAVIEVDEKRLRQILMNLLANAVKFTEQGHVQLSVRYSDGKLHMQVSDTGIGIAHDRTDSLFQPFHQAGDSSYRSQGTGLGLAISRTLVEQMGGNLEMTSELGKGSIFDVTIPAPGMQDDEFPLSSKAGFELTISGYERSDGRDEPLTLLLVDDSQENLNVLRGMLQPVGFRICEATGGLDALQVVTQDQPDLILMDLVMPDLNGLEATRRVHALPRASNLPVVVVSASAFAEDRQQSHEAGAVAHISKPVHLEHLLRVLEQILPLVWLHEQQSSTQHQSDAGEEVLTPEQIEQLRMLLRRGAIRNIQSFLKEQVVGQPDSAQLKKLLEVADRFDLKRLSLLLKQQ